MAALFRLRWRLAHLICPELGVEARLSALRGKEAKEEWPVEVQVERDGPWRSAQVTGGQLHWVPGPMGTEAAARLQAIHDGLDPANHEARAAIAAALAQSVPQSPAEGIRPASQVRHDCGLNGAATTLRFRFPQSAPQGAS
ncbi:hypothetical protein [Tabrizicola sp.]|uniref:hypothetical protein n=1 Tax=Tabrizicola sp. TaxID=2005166 RepID=UPI002FDE4FCB